MVTKVLIDFLEDENTNINLKYQYIRNLNLSYSDIFELMEKFKYDDIVYNLLKSFVSYSDSKIIHKIRKQETKRKKAGKQKRIRQIRRDISYD